jgi:hypothetical protein
MNSIFRSLHAALTRLTHRAPGRRPDGDVRDWMPPVLGSCDLASPYFLAMADRDAGWYLERY